MARYVYTIRGQDIGALTLDIEGRMYLVQNFLGTIQPRDVGKLVYLVDDGTLQVESDYQRDERVYGENR